MFANATLLAGMPPRPYAYGTSTHTGLHSAIPMSVAHLLAYSAAVIGYLTSFIQNIMPTVHIVQRIVFVWHHAN